MSPGDLDGRRPDVSTYRRGLEPVRRSCHPCQACHAWAIIGGHTPPVRPPPDPVAVRDRARERMRSRREGPKWRTPIRKPASGPGSHQGSPESPRAHPGITRRRRRTPDAGTAATWGSCRTAPAPGPGRGRGPGDHRAARRCRHLLGRAPGIPARPAGGVQPRGRRVVGHGEARSRVEQHRGRVLEVPAARRDVHALRLPGRIVDRAGDAVDRRRGVGEPHAAEVRQVGDAVPQARGLDDPLGGAQPGGRRLHQRARRPTWRVRAIIVSPGSPCSPLASMLRECDRRAAPQIHANHAEHGRRTGQVTLIRLGACGRAWWCEIARGPAAIIAQAHGLRVFPGCWTRKTRNTCKAWAVIGRASATDRLPGAHPPGPGRARRSAAVAA